MHLIEDRPPVNITSPGPVPIDLNVVQIYVVRNDDGVFNLSSQKPDHPAFSKNHSKFRFFFSKPPVKVFSNIPVIETEPNYSIRLSNLVSDNEELRRKLVAFERISEENRLLRKSKLELADESNILRNHLKNAQDDVSTVYLAFKNSLVHKNFVLQISKLLEEKTRLLDEVKSLRDQLSSSSSWKWKSES